MGTRLGWKGGNAQVFFLFAKVGGRQAEGTCPRHGRHIRRVLAGFGAGGMDNARVMKRKEQAAEPTVVLDARWVEPRLSGIGRYTLELLRCFGRDAGGFRFRVWALSGERAGFIREAAGLEGNPAFAFEVFSKGPFSPAATAGDLAQHGRVSVQDTLWVLPKSAWWTASIKTTPLICVCTQSA